jgi:hypothetical protein
VILAGALGAVAGAGVGWLVSRNLSRLTGTCPLMCNPKIAVPYFALLGMLVAGQYAG